MSIRAYTIHHDPDDSIVVECPDGHETLSADDGRDWDDALTEAGYRRVSEWATTPGQSYEYECQVEEVH